MRNFKIRAAAADTAEILLYGDIGMGGWGEGVSAKEFAAELKDAGDVSFINLRINSAGGDIFDGMAIFSQLQRHPAIVNVSIDGLAASVASVVAMAGDTITMPENAYMMIHNPWAAMVGYASDMRKMADTLDKVGLGIVAAYQSQCDLPDAEILKMMDAETWLTGAEAVALGLADTAAPAVPIAAHFDFSQHKFLNTPVALLGVPAKTTPPAEPAEAAPLPIQPANNIRRRKLDLADRLGKRLSAPRSR